MSTFLYDKNLVLVDGDPYVDTLKHAIGKGVTAIEDDVIDSNDSSAEIGDSFLIGDPVEIESTFHTTQQILRIKGNEAYFATQEEWKSYLKSIIPAGTQPYHKFKFNSLQQDTANPDTDSYYTSEMHHNRSFFRYERLSRNFDTRMLPNYSLRKYFEEQGNPFSEMGNLVSFNEAMEPGFHSGVFYYKDYIRNIRNVLQNSGEHIAKNSNIFILTDVVTDSDAHETPHYLKNSFFVKEDPVFEFEIADVAASFDFKNVLKSLEREKRIFQFVKSQEPSALNFYFSNGTPSVINSYDIFEWLSGQLSSTFEEGADELFLLDSQATNESAMENMFLNVVFYSWLVSLSKTKMRNPKQIFNNNLCHREIIGFKVEKFIEREFGDPVQTFYISANPGSFVDSQLKYSQKYLYKTTALVAVIGTNYQYTDLSTTSEDFQGFVSDSSGLPTTDWGVPTTGTYEANITMLCVPSFKILEVPFNSKEEVFIELPPNIPDFSFFNESGQVNDLNIFLSHEYLETEQEYIPISEDDEDFLEKSKLSQNSNSNILKTSYIYNSGYFEIFRSNEPPMSYKDMDRHFLTSFNNDKVSHLTIKNEYTNAQYCHAAQFEDVILPNKKYYYLFRALTEHGNASSPTKILEVEIIEDSDESYVTVEPYEFPKNIPYKYNKNMRRFLQIIPNSLQTNIVLPDGISSATELEIGGPDLGSSTPAIWDKKFKIRLTSKHTGKKMDINLVFKRKKE